MRRKAFGGEHYCFGCSARNRAGMRLRFEYDPATGRARADVRLARRFEGPPGAAHGGVIAALLDEAMTKVNAGRGVKALTVDLRVRYRRFVPLGEPLALVAWRRGGAGRVERLAARIEDAAGTPLALGAARFLRVSRRSLDRRRARLERAAGRE